MVLVVGLYVLVGVDYGNVAGDEYLDGANCFDGNSDGVKKGSMILFIECRQSQS